MNLDNLILVAHEYQLMSPSSQEYLNACLNGDIGGIPDSAAEQIDTFLGIVQDLGTDDAVEEATEIRERLHAVLASRTRVPR